MVAIEPRSDALIKRRIRQQIPGKLFNDELIERHVPVEGFDHPVAPAPHFAIPIHLVTVRVAIARCIQPAESHSLRVPR